MILINIKEYILYFSQKYYINKFEGMHSIRMIDYSNGCTWLHFRFTEQFTFATNMLKFVPVKISLSITARENCQNTQLNSSLTHANFMLESLNSFFFRAVLVMTVCVYTLIRVYEFPRTSENAYACMSYAYK